LGQNGCGRTKRVRKVKWLEKSQGLLLRGIVRKGIDYEETFAPVARSEAIRILLAFSVAKGFKLHQMDVKCAFFEWCVGGRSVCEVAIGV
jgi:hypothetical protein